MIVPMKNLLLDAEVDNRAVGAFSVGNMEMIMGAVKAAQELNTPIILQIAEKRLNNSPIELMGPMMVNAAVNSNIDIAVHLDHGLSINCIKKALDYGFSSVMLDCSLKPYTENVEITKKIVDIAKDYKASVEAELGIVGGNEGDTDEHVITCTNPNLAKEFCIETKIDALAIAIGNAHGNYPVLPELRFDILEKINLLTNTPLVLHGGTGITPNMFRKAISLGIRKINIATGSFDLLTEYAKNYILENSSHNYFSLSEKMIEGVYTNVSNHIKIFNNKEQ